MVIISNVEEKYIKMMCELRDALSRTKDEFTVVLIHLCKVNGTNIFPKSL